LPGTLHSLTAWNGTARISGNLTPNRCLYEMRLKGAAGIARVFYRAIVERRIVMLHCFVKKTPWTPLKELEIARRRLKEVRDDNL